LLFDPLLSKDAMNREIESMESEFEGSFTLDSAREQQLMCLLSEKGHLLNRFLWGNLASLRGGNPEGLWDDLRKLFVEEYSADRMKLVIQVAHPPSNLKDSIEELFGRLPNKSKGI